MDKPTSLSDALFTGVQKRVLGLLFGQPGKSLHGNEILALTHSGKGGLRRILQRLVQSGLVSVTKVGNQKRYQANAGSPIFDELCGIVRKTFGLADVLRDALQPIGSQIRLAFIYGSIAKETDTVRSDIDLFVLSDTLSYQDLLSALAESEAQIGRKISPTLYTEAELAGRRSDGNSFILRVLEQPKLFLIGGPIDLE